MFKANEVVKTSGHTGSEQLDENGWPVGYFDKIPGSMPDLERAPQGVYEERQKKGNRIGPRDLQIAAIAMRHDLTLVTHNIDEFRRIDDLKLENWETSK